MKKISLFFLLMAAGCQTSTPIPPDTTPHILTNEQKAAVEKGVRESLKDPSSSVFGPMSASEKRSGVFYVCGYVNAKNSFGGYVGNQPYIGVLGSLTSNPNISVFSVVNMGGTKIKTDTVNFMCKHYGVPGF